MKRTIHSVADLGIVLRAVRKSSGVRLDDFAAMARVSKQFATDVERGKPTVQMGRVLLLLQELGVTLQVDVPEAAAPLLEKLEARRRSHEEEA
jgi:transcriptional regulator with XRE-family HTH domain